MKKKYLGILISILCVLICCFAFWSASKTGEYKIIVPDNLYGEIITLDSADAGEKVTVMINGLSGYSDYVLYVNGQEISGNEFTMPDMDVKLSATFSNTSASAGAVTVLPSEDGETVSDLKRAVEGERVTLTAYPTYNRQVDYFTLNGEKIEGNSFIMPAGDVTVAAVYKEVYTPTDVSLSVTASYQKATSHWYASYTSQGVEIRTIVEDNLVFTSKAGTTNVAMADNIEFIIALKHNSSTFTNNIYKMLVNADGEYFYQQGNGSGFVTIGSLGIKVEVERLNIFTHGLSGYTTKVLIPYTALGTTYLDAYGNVSICPAMRNTTNTLKTIWSSYSGMNCNWSVPSTHLVIDTNGNMNIGIANSNYLFTGDQTLSSITSTAGMSVLKGTSTYTKKSSTIRYWIENIKDILRFQAEEVYFTCGTEDLKSRSVLSVFKDMRDFITLFKNSSRSKLYIVSSIPSVFSDDPRAVSAFNLMVKEYVAGISGVEYIDFCSDVCVDGKINKSLYASDSTLSEEGNYLLKKYILSASNKFSENEVSLEWGSVGPYLYMGDWSYSDNALLFRTGGTGKIYYKGGTFTDFVLECSMSVSEIYNGDQYPKFGITLTNENHSRYYYVSAVEMTEEIAGVVEKPYSGYDWLNGTSFGVSMKYKHPDKVTLKIVKLGDEIIFYINGEVVANTQTGEFGEENITFGLFSFNLALDITDIRVVTDPDQIQEEVGN